MTEWAPAASAFTRSPEYLMPPSAMTARPRPRPRGALQNRGDLGHADARDDARRADDPGQLMVGTSDREATAT